MILEYNDKGKGYNNVLPFANGNILPTSSRNSSAVNLSSNHTSKHLNDNRPNSFAHYTNLDPSSIVTSKSATDVSRSLNNIPLDQAGGSPIYRKYQKSPKSISPFSSSACSPQLVPTIIPSNSLNTLPNLLMTPQTSENVSMTKNMNLPTQERERSRSLLSTPLRASRSSSRGFFSRFRRNSLSAQDEDDEDHDQFKTRDEGWNAGVFESNACLTTAPKYIWVHAHKKRNREFTRLFLAQELGELPDKVSRFVPRRSSSTDSRSKSKTRSSSADPGGDRKKAIWCAKFSPDGQFLATAGADCVIRIWKVISDPREHDLFNVDEMSDEDTPLNSTNQQQNATPNVSTSQSQQPPALGSKNYRRASIRRNSQQPKKQQVSAPVFLPKPVLEYSGHTQDILDICWSKNNFLLSSSMDKTVKLWHPQLSESIKTFVHNDFVTSVAFHPSDDRFFLSGSLDCRVRLWCITENKIEYFRDAPDFVMAVAFSLDGDTAVAGCFGGQCIFYETNNGLKQKSQMTIKSGQGKNSNGSRITGLQVMEIPSRYPVLDNYSDKSTQNKDEKSGNSNKSGGGSPKDIRLLVSTSDSRVRMYNFYNKSLISTFKGQTTHQGQISASFSDTGEYVISGSEDEKTYIWRSNTGQGANASSQQGSYEYFHSNKSTVTVALFAPLKARSLLYNSRDPIYDLAAPPVILTPSTSNEAGTGGVGGLPRSSSKSLTDWIEPNPSDGNIIITCGQDGLIKVFRQDSAYNRRKLVCETASGKRR